MIPIRRVETCRVCRSPLGGPFLDLGHQPLANMLTQSQPVARQAPVFPLALTRCAKCAFAMLTRVVPPEEMFSEYLYVPSASAAMRQHFTEAAANITAASHGPPGGDRGGASPPPYAVDIGSNDGFFLSALKVRGWRVRGVDPARRLAEEATRAGVPTTAAFWGSEAVTVVHKETEGQGADLITAFNVFAHCDDWAGFLTDVARSLAATGRFVLEVPYLLQMLRDGTFDLIYHEHLSYPSVTALARAAFGAELVVTAVEETPVHGGSIRVTIQRTGEDASLPWREAEAAVGLGDPGIYTEFAKHAYAAADRLREWIWDARSEGKTVVGYSCPAKASTVIHAARLCADDIAWVADDNPAKVGRFMPVTGIPVVAPQDLKSRPWDVVVIFAWNVAHELIPRLPTGRTALIPMPDLHVIAT